MQWDKMFDQSPDQMVTLWDPAADKTIFLDILPLQKGHYARRSKPGSKYTSENKTCQNRHKHARTQAQVSENSSDLHWTCCPVHPTVQKTGVRPTKITSTPWRSCESFQSCIHAIYPCDTRARIRERWDCFNTLINHCSFRTPCIHSC